MGLARNTTAYLTRHRSSSTPPTVTDGTSFRRTHDALNKPDATSNSNSSSSAEGSTASLTKSLLAITDKPQSTIMTAALAASQASLDSSKPTGTAKETTPSHLAQCLAQQDTSPQETFEEKTSKKNRTKEDRVSDHIQEEIIGVLSFLNSANDALSKQDPLIVFDYKFDLPKALTYLIKELINTGVNKDNGFIPYIFKHMHSMPKNNQDIISIETQKGTQKGTLNKELKNANVVIAVCSGVVGEPLGGDALKNKLNEYLKLGVTNLTIYISPFDDLAIDESQILTFQNEKFKAWMDKNKSNIDVLSKITPIKILFHDELKTRTSFKETSKIFQPILSNDARLGMIISDDVKAFLTRKEKQQKLIAEDLSPMTNITGSTRTAINANQNEYKLEMKKTSSLSSPLLFGGVDVVAAPFITFTLSGEEVNMPC